jgi:capsular exopolysaccharide synthesis family protein
MVLNPPATPSEPEAGRDLVSWYLAGLYRRRWLAIVSFVLVTAAVAAALFVRPRVFDASTRLEIVPPGAVTTIFDTEKSERSATNQLDTERQVLASRQLARRVIHALKLWDVAEFVAPEDRAPYAALADVSPDSEQAAMTLSPLVSAFLSRISINQVPDTNIVDVHFEAGDAALTARVVNELARQYVAYHEARHEETSRDASDWLSRQIEQQRQKVEASENALQQYKEQQNVVTIEARQRNIVLDRLSDLNAALTRAKTERLAKETVLRQVENAQANPAALDSVPALASNGALQVLKAQLTELQRRRAELTLTFGERHPEMIKVETAIEAAQQRLKAEVQRAIDVVRNDHAAAQAEELSLTKALDEQKREALRFNRQTLDYGELELEANSNRQVYEALLQEAKKKGVTGAAAEGSKVRIIDPAEVPLRPVRPEPARDLAMSVVSGLCLSLALVSGVEFFRRIRTPEDVQRQLKLPCLGLLSTYKLPSSSGGIAFDADEAAMFSEGLRRVRSVILQLESILGRQIILVASSAPKEGKSTVSANLAVALAASGRRVVLLDADMRRARAHDAFSVDRVPGLSDVLSGQVTDLSLVIRQTTYPNLSMIPSGATIPNPSELLSRPHLAALLTNLKEQFDCVIIDSSPVMAVTDATIIAPHASCVLFVARAEVTRFHVASIAVEQLTRAGAKFAGVVLNAADFRHQPLVYASYHSQEYETYYGKSRSRA